MQVSISLEMLHFAFCAYIIFYFIVAKTTIIFITYNCKILCNLVVDSSYADYVISICLSIYCPVNQLIMLESLLFYCMF